MFNEPEWMIHGGYSLKHKIGIEYVKSFTTKANKIIKAAGLKTTVGSASLKWSCKCGHWCEGDWWGDTEIDFRTIHYSSWMSRDGYRYDPFSTKPSDWCLDGDILIGASPSWNDQSYNHDEISVKDQFWYAKHNGWSGVMPWADIAKDCPNDLYSSIDAGLKCD